MSNENTTRDLSSGSPERVTYDLMLLISESESESELGKKRDREYWMTLYYQCSLLVINRNPLKVALAAN
jgi:hypothetical protein